MGSIAVVDYGMGNLRSVAKALERVGCETIVTDRPADILKADGVVLPGVGAFPQSMENLRKGRWVAPLLEFIQEGRPFLGVCLGYQVLFEGSDEFGGSEGLSLIPGWVHRFSESSCGDRRKVPHIGWNSVKWGHPSAIFSGIPDRSFFYFVHSYYPVPKEDQIVSGWTDYGVPFASAIQWKNVFGCQFHPEKSQTWGLKVLDNFREVVQRS